MTRTIWDAEALNHVSAKWGLRCAATCVETGDGPPVVTCSGQQFPGGPCVTAETLFRVASLSKPVTTVAALRMMDAGLFQLDDAITRFAPEFEAPKVLKSPSATLSEVEASQRPITFRDLLTQRAGLSYRDFLTGELAAAYAGLGGQIDNPLHPDEWVARLASLPLVTQPGASFCYGHATDLLGVLLSRIDRAPLSEVLRHRVFQPLGMNDTTFSPTPSQRERCVALYGFDTSGNPCVVASLPSGDTLAVRPAAMTFESGGQGLWSTLNDYSAFLRVLAPGSGGGRELLTPETRSLMTSNALSATQRAEARLLGRKLFARGHGYGLGVAVVIEPAHADPLLCRGNAGTVGWPGAFGGWWQVDPVRDHRMLFLTHNILGPGQLEQGIGLGIYGAIADFHAANCAREVDRA
jgi:CubicO group peptidase (beta-lactamase class C family)